MFGISIQDEYILGSRPVMTSMLDYLKSINSPLYEFLSKHSRIKELTATNPYPTFTAYVTQLGVTPITFIAELAFWEAISNQMMGTTLLYNTVNASREAFITCWRS